MIQKVREIVMKEATEGDWKYHILAVVKYSKLLAKKLGANEETAEIAALLHDIGRIKFGGENHEITGIPEAEKILSELKYSKEVIDEVKHCIESHRGSKNIPPKTSIAKIVASADAMAHFDSVPHLLKLGLAKSNNDFGKASIWVHEKLDRSWKKITIPEAREMVKEKYEAFKILFNDMESAQNTKTS